jgi:small-conductance mechanosensitive channel
MEVVNSFLDLQLLRVGDYQLKVYSLIILFIIFILTKLSLWLIKKVIFRRTRLNQLDAGNSFALFQIVKYLIWIIASVLFLETVGVRITVLLAGSAALLVGVGLGLQQTFNDVISGIILLSERSIKINDILEIDKDVVKIQEIGIRTCKGLNRDDISIIIPNSMITNNKVINWSHQSNETRFKIEVGVAYGSDVELVVQVLRESALEHPEVSDKSLIDVRLLDFADSSIYFQLLFFSENIFRIEKVKSDIRIIINRKFIANKISIPNKQMDVHLK